LFSAAISESGLCASTVSEPTKAEAEAAGIAVAEQVGCPGTGPSAAACLRGKSVDELLAATSAPPPAQQTTTGGPFYAAGTYLATLPNIDGFVIERSLRDSFAAGGFEPRPLIVGANRDEGTLFHSALFALPIANETDYRAALGRRFGDANVDAIVARYPVASFPSANRALAEVTGDAFFVCPARRTARGAAAAGAPVYYYSFQREPAQPFLAGLGVFHSSEVPFVFGTDPAYPLARVGADGEAVAATMRDYWTRLAATGDPNGGDAPAWPTYDGDRHLVLDTAITAGTGYKTDACDFWDALR
jgi:para-nitrobenzyl esterase